MTARDLLAELVALGAALTLEGERLRLTAPRGAVSRELQAELSEHRAELIALLSAPVVPPWAGQRVKIEDLPAFRERWGLRVVAGSWPEGQACPVLTCCEVSSE